MTDSELATTSTTVRRVAIIVETLIRDYVVNFTAVSFFRVIKLNKYSELEKKKPVESIVRGQIKPILSKNQCHAFIEFPSPAVT